jgi:hypothetical protein
MEGEVIGSLIELSIGEGERFVLESDEMRRAGDLLGEELMQAERSRRSRER